MRTKDHNYPVIYQTAPDKAGHYAIVAFREGHFQPFAVWNCRPDGHTYSGFYTDDIRKALADADKR